MKNLTIYFQKKANKMTSYNKTSINYMKEISSYNSQINKLNKIMKLKLHNVLSTQLRATRRSWTNGKRNVCIMKVNQTEYLSQKKQILDFIPKVQELENKNEMYEIQLKTINNILDKKEQLIQELQQNQIDNQNQENNNANELIVKEGSIDENEIQKLKLQLEESTQELKSLRKIFCETIADKQEQQIQLEYQNLRSQISEKDSIIMQLKNQMELRKTHQSLIEGQSFEDLQQIIQNQEQQIKKLAGELDKYKQDKNSEDDSIKIFEDKINEEQEKNKQFQNVIKNIEQEKEKLKLVINQKSQENNQNELRITQHSLEKIQELEHNNLQLTKQIQQLRETLNQLNSTLQAKQDELLYREQLIENLKQESLKAEELIAENEKQFQSQIKELQSIIEQKDKLHEISLTEYTDQMELIKKQYETRLNQKLNQSQVQITMQKDREKTQMQVESKQKQICLLYTSPSPRDQA
eukprot:TRINITY_DN5164_c0_g1_i4.p1 TRINITY_DN5164_c0_g1~~TRINITY_DN5164_c0_g1_i4.p1  ORF type:complete len:467 (-),score=107.98 TRINITY_DN5164_c0_g1_i4:47-1447(-)